MKKKNLLKNLKEKTFCRLGVSKYGVGVFAIKDIPMETELFEDYRTLGYLKDVEEQFPFLKRM